MYQLTRRYSKPSKSRKLKKKRSCRQNLLRIVAERRAQKMKFKNNAMKTESDNDSVNPLPKLEHCIVKEEFIIPEGDTEYEEGDISTFDEAHNKMLTENDCFSKTVIKQEIDEIHEEVDIPIVEPSPCKEIYSNNKSKQKTRNKIETARKAKENGNGLVQVVEQNIETAMKNLSKSFCQHCNRKAKVIRSKARCTKCENPLIYMCENCDKTVKTYNSLRHHLQVLHVINNGSNICSKCNREFLHRSNLIIHEKICGREPEFACNDCPYKAYYKTNLTAHIKEKHSGHVFDCKKCKKVFSNKRSLMRHIRCYCGKKQSIQCHHCLHKVYRKDHMIGHLERNHGDELYGIKRILRNCKYCGKTFKKHEHIRYHLNHCKEVPDDLADQDDTSNKYNLDAATKELSRVQCSKCKGKRKLTHGLASCKKCKIPLTFSCIKCSYETKVKSSLYSHFKCKHKEYQL